MMVLEAHEIAENRDGCAGSGSVKLVADGGVETGTGLGLDFLQDGEEATEAVADIEVGEIEAHGDGISSEGL